MIYNLFGEPTWSNFYKLGVFNLDQLKEIVAKKQAGEEYHQQWHNEITAMLEYAAKSFDLAIPEYWR
ncbi:hypothetical protein [Pseudomaricurvus alcaniphilus]|uniref:hypothetical protein n=1 Tax=Pseudomaricurvus alcaniphilus TaxID=1166482 RepID=UPI001FB7182C|nr:hypothetical protein [Pseudomaricurvus alcaniphilus]